MTEEEEEEEHEFIGWRGNREDWVRRMQPIVFGTTDTLFLRRIAERVCDPRLLRPAVACAIPVKKTVGIGAAAMYPILWHDVQHVMLGRCRRRDNADVAWIGAAAYYVRQRPRMGSSVVEALRTSCRSNALRLALEDETWSPFGVSRDQVRTRVRTVHMLVAIDPTADRQVLCAAHAWLQRQKRSAASVTVTAALLHHSQSVFARFGISEGSGSSSIVPPPPQLSVRPIKFDPFVSETLRFFDDNTTMDGMV